MTRDQRAKLMARQGHAFATASEVRVVYAAEDGKEEGKLVDVPRDGKTLGEIVTRGNIVMKEVGKCSCLESYKPDHFALCGVVLP